MKEILRKKKLAPYDYKIEKRRTLMLLIAVAILQIATVTIAAIGIKFGPEVISLGYRMLHNQYCLAESHASAYMTMAIGAMITCVPTICAVSVFVWMLCPLYKCYKQLSSENTEE